MRSDHFLLHGLDADQSGLGYSLPGSEWADGFSRALGAGLCESFAMGFINAYFDESGKGHERPIVSFAGFTMDPGDVQRFDRLWRRELRKAGLDCLTMKDAMRLDRPFGGKILAMNCEARIEALKPFAHCILKYADVVAFSALEVEAFKRMSPDSRRYFGNNPHYAGFIRTVLELADHHAGEDWLLLTCDDDEETAERMLKAYRNLRQIHPERKRKIAGLAFCDDMFYPALQAADLLAALGRREAGKRFFDQAYDMEPLMAYIRTIEPADVEIIMGFWGDDEMSGVSTARDKLDEKVSRMLPNTTLGNLTD